MFDPSKPDAILALEDKDLTRFPTAEDDRHEYKSGATKDPELAEKLARAASGFWNSGGGLFVVGVNGQGQADGGIAVSVGRQPRRDWIDQALSRVSPRARYVVQGVENRGAGLNIAAGNAIFLVGFGESEVGPHMAPDNRYYIRAGAHTVAASHFIVEAIHARRGLRTPVIQHVVRRKPSDPGVLQVGFVALSPLPAIDVSIHFDPLPPWLQKWSAHKFPLQAPVISEQFPLFVDVHWLMLGDHARPSFQAKLIYSDLVGRHYDQVFQVDLDRQLGPNLGGENPTHDIERLLRDIERAVEKVAEAVKSKR